MSSIDPSRLSIRSATPKDYAQIEQLLLESDSLYPGIDFWWRKRVIPGLEGRKRVVFVVDGGDSLEGLFIGKIDTEAKLCTLRLRDSVRYQGIGRALTTEGLSHLLRYRTNRIHVTISEAAEEGAVPFFESVGFQRVDVLRDRYRKGVDEFVYAAPGDEIAETIKSEFSQGVEQTLFGTVPVRMPYEETLLMSLKPEFAEPILKGWKRVEFRRKFSAKYEGATVLFYLTNPVKKFMFSAKIAKIDHQPKSRLWEKYSEEGGVSKEVFTRYYAGTDYGYAIQLTDVVPVNNPLSLEDAKRLRPGFLPPQSFQRIKHDSPLPRAVGLPLNL